MAQELTADQLRGMGLNPDETTSTQTLGGKTYKLDNTGRGTRYLNEVSSTPTTSTPDMTGVKNDLNSRYDKLISSLKAQGDVAADKQTAITSGELGKRGILGSSTLAKQDIQTASEAARLPYTTASTQADVDRSNAILGLAVNEMNTGENKRQFDISSGLKQAELDLAKKGTKYQTLPSTGGYLVDSNGNITKVGNSTGSTGSLEDLFNQFGLS